MEPHGDLARRVAARLSGPPPHLVGVCGAVAAGKSTVALRLARAFESGGRRVGILATDAFLLPTAVLDGRGLTFRKGFPESFDMDGLASALERMKKGLWPVRVPVYSHSVYDIVPGEVDVVDESDLVMVDGVVVLQPPVADLLDASVYVDADESDLRRWFVERFCVLADWARTDPSSFYSAFVSMGPDEIRALANATWDGINAVNLRDHILPSRERATFVVEKGSDHSILRVQERE